MAELSWPWLVFWLFAFVALGLGIGWSFRGLMVERHEHDDCDGRAEKAEAEQDRLRADLDIATVKLNAHERHNRELRAEYEQGVTCACCGGKVMGREGHVIKVCPICGFDNFPEGGVHAAYYIHMLDHERRGKGKEE